MSMTDTSINKQPLKLIEVPLIKFQEEVIPHHQSIFEQHKSVALKLITQNNVKLLRQEVKAKKRVTKQLKDLMYELDTLRTQVENSDLDKFDTRTLCFRKTIITLISGYTDIEKQCIALENQQIDEEEMLLEKSHPFEGALQVQLHENLDEVKLRQQQELLTDVENVQRDAEDLNQMFTHLHEMVDEQRENVEKIDEQVENTQENVQSGLKQLIKAHKIKATAFPVTGAFIGTMIGGPIGLVAGFKIGGLTALGCAIAGYTGGRIFKKNCETVMESDEIHGVTINTPVTSDTPEKKDI